MPIAQSLLDTLWDFSDPEASEKRLRLAAMESLDPGERRELYTQVARALGLQGRFGEGHGQLDAIDPDGDAVATRLSLERGRLHNSDGAPREAARHFRAALERSAAAPELRFLHVDALHMLAIAEPDRAEEWAARGLHALADVDDPRTLRWLVALHNNLGWGRFDAGRPADALPEFELALDAAERYGTPQQLQWAREALEECRATLS